MRAISKKTSPQPNRSEILCAMALVTETRADHCQYNSATMMTINMSRRTGRHSIKRNSHPHHDFLGDFLWDLPPELAFLLAIEPLAQQDALELHLHHKRKNHGPLFSLFIVESTQYISDFSVDKTPIGRAVTATVQGSGN